MLIGMIGRKMLTMSGLGRAGGEGDLPEDPQMKQKATCSRASLLLPTIWLSKKLKLKVVPIDCPQSGPGPRGPGSGPDRKGRSECPGQRSLARTAVEGARASYFLARTLGSVQVRTWTGPIFFAKRASGVPTRSHSSQNVIIINLQDHRSISRWKK